jgi:ubiquinone/menaquinone biosynthesis C-methylase UbiE
MMTEDLNLSPPNDPRIPFFDRLAAKWDHSEQDPLDTVNRIGGYVRLLGFRSGETVLEVGCGTGQLTGWLAEQVAPGRVVAVDFSAGMLAKAQAKGADAEFRVADACRDDLGRACFDAVLCFHSFPHFRDKPAAVRNLARALKPAGRMMVMHFNSLAGVNAFHDQVGGDVAGDHLPEQGGWDTLLAAAGLRRVEWIDREGLFFLKAEFVAQNGD